MLFRVDAISNDPIYEQLADQIRVAILQGALKPGDKLSPARELATALEVNLHTVLHAYQILRDEGLIELRRGRGAIVSAHSSSIPAEITGAIGNLVVAMNKTQVSPTTVLALVKEALK